MKTIGFRRFGAVLLFFCCLFLGFGCGKKGGNEDSLKPPQAYTPGKTTVLVPEAPGTVTTGEDPLILDFSNAGQGYFMGKLTQPDTKINIRSPVRTMSATNIFLRKQTVGPHFRLRQETAHIWYSPIRKFQMDSMLLCSAIH